MTTSVFQGPVSFFVTGHPITQGSLRVIHGRLIDDNAAALRHWRSLIVGGARVAWQGAPLDRPVCVELLFYLPTKTSRPGYSAWSMELRRNDLDKHVRAVFDALTVAGVWRDDAVAVSLRASKLRASPPDRPAGVAIRIEAIDPLDGL